MAPTPFRPAALSIAGSDSSAGAGIAADLKTFAALGVYGCCAITAITAQNTLGVQAVEVLEPKLVGQQIGSLMEDLAVHAVKTGMLASAGIVHVVADEMQRKGIDKLVVDPVLVSSSGSPLLDEAGLAALKQRLLPLALVVTPNIPEAEALLGKRITSTVEIMDAARAIRDMGARAVIIKGGHRTGSADDVLCDADGFRTFSGRRIDTVHTHGTGCAFSAAITAGLARDLDLRQATALAKSYISAALGRAYAVGRGRSPVNHFPW